MSITVIGEVPISTINPAAASLSVALTAGTGPTLSAMTAQISGLGEAALGLIANPPNLATLLAQAQALVVAIEAALVQGIPSVDVQLAAILSAQASLQLQASAIQASLDVAAQIPLGVGIQAAVYTGPTANFGAEMGAYFGNGIQGGGPATDAVVLCIGATQAQSKAAMAVVFGV